MKILIADDHTIVREGAKKLLALTYPFAEITDVSDSIQLLEMAMNKDWDVIITDINMPSGDSTIENIKAIKAHAPAIHIIVLSMHPPKEYAVRSIAAGASCYLSKNSSSDELILAVDRAMAGKKYLSAEVADIMADTVASKSTRSIATLSKREHEVFTQLALDKHVNEIAKEMGVSKNTISTFRTRIFEKMGFESNMELIKYAVDNKLS